MSVPLSSRISTPCGQSLAVARRMSITRYLRPDVAVRPIGHRIDEAVMLRETGTVGGVGWRSGVPPPVRRLAWVILLRTGTKAEVANKKLTGILKPFRRQIGFYVGVTSLFGRCRVGPCGFRG